jgi:hypothetical protein
MRKVYSLGDVSYTARSFIVEDGGQ